uniref:Lipocalin/cytosolic fatty-acid binding domain-containing protein n=1 Tax=Capra hircus TaxID=9925 RepID=A0A8C2P8Y7_CAPHI
FVFTQTMQGLRLRVAAGAWHSEAVAASNISLLDAETTPPRVYVEELKPTPEGDLEILLQKRWVENHECVEKTLMAQKTEDPTVFTVDYHGERKISVLDTDYSSYMTFCKEGPTHTDEGRPDTLPTARTPEVDDEAMEKFARALASLSEDVQMVLDLSLLANCRVAGRVSTLVG